MPLTTDNIDEARVAYAALELRAQNAEANAATLQAQAGRLSSAQQSLSLSASRLHEFVVSQIQANAQLLAQQTAQVSPDLTLDGFIAALGLAAALGEASMPDRAVNSVKVAMQSYLTFTPGPDGVSKVTGLRFYQPEFGASALATTTFEIAKVAGPPGAAAPRSLYAVLQDKQAAFADPFWMAFATGNPAAYPASRIVAGIAGIFAHVDAWNIPYLVQESTAIAGLETTLSALVGKSAPAAPAAAYAAAVARLSALAKALNPATRSNFVAGDLYALTAALDATTKIANTLRP
jgi:hypothetical protein